MNFLLESILQFNQRTRISWNMTTNVDKTLFDIDFEDLEREREIREKVIYLNNIKHILGFYLKALRSYFSVSHMSTHFFVLEDSTRVLTLTCRSRCSVGKRVTMGCILHFEIPTLHCALETFSNRCTSDIYKLTRSVMSHTEHVSCW